MPIVTFRWSKHRGYRYAGIEISRYFYNSYGNLVLSIGLWKWSFDVFFYMSPEKSDKAGYISADMTERKSD
jgi:hypothetical protein